MANNSIVPTFPKIDKRLLGTWKSDRTRTFQEWVWVNKSSPQKKRRFKAIFGKLKIKYTRTRIIFTPHSGWQQARRYQVVAIDDTSVVIVSFGKLEIKNRREYASEDVKVVEDFYGAKPTLQHIHFDKRHYWISLGNSRNREFFRKIH